MKRNPTPVFVCALLVLAAFAANVSAQPVPAQSGLTRVDRPAMTLSAAVMRLKERAARGRKVIQLETSDSSFLIPAAGSVRGAGNTYFHSDFALANNKAATQTIGIGWVAQGVDNSAAPLDYFDIPSLQVVFQADIVGDLLGKSGLGSLVVFGETSGLSFDSSALLTGFSRIWTNQPNASGTVSLQFPAVSLADSVGTAHAYALGLRHDSQYRTNAGIVNLDSVAHTWTVRILGINQSGQTSITVKPFSMMQVALPNGNYGDLFLDFQTTAPGIFFSVYGASVDNITGDGWVARGIQP